MVFQVVLPDDTIKVVAAQDQSNQRMGQRSNNDRRPLLTDYDIHRIRAMRNNK